MSKSSNNHQLEMFPPNAYDNELRLIRAQRPHYKLQYEDKKDMVEMYQHGAKIKDIAEKFSISESSAYMILKRREVLHKRIYDSKMTAAIKQAILERYEHDGARAIAAEFDCTNKNVHFWASQLGLRSLNKNHNVSIARANGNTSVNYKFFAVFL